MKKRALSLFFASVAAAGVISGCGSEISSSIIILDGGNPAQQTTLTVYGHRTDKYSLDVIEDALQSYMSENSSVNVSYESASDLSYWQALDRRNAADRLDDVFMTDRDRLLSLTANGKLADLSDAVDEDMFNDFARSQLYKSDGATYAVPACISTYGLYVNYGLLSQHGMKVPENFNKFTEVCDYFVSQGVTPVIINNYSSLRSLILARGMYDTYCTADTASEIEKFNADPSSLAQPLNAGIDFVYEMKDKGWLNLQETELTDPSDDLKLFAEGKRPFMITGGWASTALKEILDKSGKNLSYGIHAFPVLYSANPDIPASVLVAQTDALISVKKGEKENDAKALVSLLTEYENLLKLNNGQSCFSALNDTQISSDSALIPSASYLKGKYVIGSDNNLKIPLDGYLTECGKMITEGKEKDEVKAHLLSLLKGESR